MDHTTYGRAQGATNREYTEAEPHHMPEVKNILGGQEIVGRIFSMGRKELL
jgi:hypothetical protein